MEIKILDSTNFDNSEITKDDVVEFLFVHLDEYGDDKESITNCLNYALSGTKEKSGKVFIALDEGVIAGAVITNETGMKGYIPENILVYIAVHKDYRGQGLGKKLMKATIDNTQGDVALHVEEDNPAKFLYESVGFTNPYLEMRFKRS